MRRDRDWHTQGNPIYSNPSLCIDEIIRELAVRSRRLRLSAIWISADEAIHFGRRSLEVAIFEADRAQHEDPSESIIYWERAENYLTKALKALTKVIAFFERASTTPEEASAIAKTLFDQTIADGALKRGIPVKAIKQEARGKAQALIVARKAIGELVGVAGGHKRSLTRERKNAGDAEKTIFVRVLAEAWVHLTGKCPGIGVERNPFLRFVEAAWTDATGQSHENESFIRALRSAILSIRKLSPTLFQSLQEKGPVWKG